MTLVQSDAIDAWGGCEIIEDAPRLEEHRDLYSLPYVENGRWGLFDREDEPIEIAIDRAWPDGRPNRCIPESNTTYAAVDRTLPDDVEYIYGGVYAPHFGHYILETLSRLWPLVDGLQPHQRVLMHGPADPHDWWMKNYVRGTFSALGVPKERIVHLGVPMKIERILVPAQSFRLNAFAYPVFRDLCHTIGERLTGAKGPTKNVRPAFLSKARMSSGVTGIVNEQSLIAELERHGVEIVFPEQLNLIEKINLFEKRKIISGWSSSSQHVSVFAPPGARMELLLGGRVLNSNCLLVDRLNNNEARYWDAAMEQLHLQDKSFLSRWALNDPIKTAHDLLERL